MKQKVPVIPVSSEDKQQKPCNMVNLNGGP